MSDTVPCWSCGHATEAPSVPRGGLSYRQLQILAGLARGQSNDEIARSLWVSEHTVKTHVAGVLRKLGARSRAHAVALAYQRRMLHAEPLTVQAALRLLNEAVDAGKQAS